MMKTAPLRWPLKLIALLWCCISGIASVNAQEESSDPLVYAVGLGVYAHDIDLDWAHDSEEQGANYNIEIVFRQTPLTLLGGRFHPNAGVSINDSGDTSFAYAGLIWRYSLAPDVTFNSGVNLVVHDGETTDEVPGSKQLGSRVLFRIPIELGYHFDSRNSIYLVFEHLSNASIETPNEGMDSMGVRYQYRF